MSKARPILSNLFVNIKYEVNPDVAFYAVVSIGSGTYILNQGGSGINTGELFDVFARGKKILDPQTQEALGFAKGWIALFEVARLTPKLSYAQLLAGDPSMLTEGSI